MQTESIHFGFSHRRSHHIAVLDATIPYFSHWPNAGWPRKYQWHDQEAESRSETQLCISVNHYDPTLKNMGHVAKRTLCERYFMQKGLYAKWTFCERDLTHLNPMKGASWRSTWILSLDIFSLTEKRVVTIAFSARYIRTWHVAKQQSWVVRTRLRTWRRICAVTSPSEIIKTRC